MCSQPYKAPIPPHFQYRDFLSEGELADLLAFTMESRPRFRASQLAGKIVDPDRRRSEQLGDLGPMRALFEGKLRAMAVDLFKRTGTKPFDIDYVELEIVAHNDGAHFNAHSDIPVGPGRERLGGDRSGRHDRLLSGVYYYYNEPKGFAGGQLRLFRFGGGDGPDDYVDIEPERNSFVIFPSWAVHEVRTIHCPSGRFEDSRYAVDAWLCRADAAKATPR
jgi:Rps23 Pro-64 3,4-dihydroxylase Tpa1-like proline 4-hydroxylase